MEKLQKKLFDKWLNAILEEFELEAKAFCFNIYESSLEGDYSVELTAFEEYDEDDEDWCCGGTEIYASRNANNEYEFSLEGGWEHCLNELGHIIESYLENGEFVKKLKQAEIVAYGFVDGDLITAYSKG